MAKHKGKASMSRFHLDYWKDRIYRKSYTRDGERHVVAEWSVRLQHLGRREAFALGTANAAAATEKAKEISIFLEANGWDATIPRFKPTPLIKAEIATLGEFLADVVARGHLRERTVRIYATKLRKIVADITKVEAGTRGKAKRAKFDYVNGGRNAWLARVNGQSMSVITPDALSAWRNTYVSRAGSEPTKRKSAERSAASMLRAGRALFADDILKVLRVKLPPNPFEGVKVRDPGPQRYHSDVNPEWLLACADRELRTAQPQVYLGLHLCLWAGLRRKEADTLTWSQVDLESGTLHVRRTPYFEPKTDESERLIDLAPAAVEVLRGFKNGCKSEFVMQGGDANPSASYGYYRADCTWRDLLVWLKGKGVTARTAIHSLRKESGSLIASDFGIEAARQHLGHRDIRTTSSHYVDKKKRHEVSIGRGNLRAVGGVA